MKILHEQPLNINPEVIQDIAGNWVFCREIENKRRKQMWCPKCKEKGILNELTRFEDNYICDECNGSFTFGMNQEKKKEKKSEKKKTNSI
jgi:ribosomal protein L37AE/L43A